MLADELEYLKAQFSDFAPVHSEIVAAPKFLLDEDFAALAASLKPDLPQLVRLLPHARLCRNKQRDCLAQRAARAFRARSLQGTQERSVLVVAPRARRLEPGNGCQGL
jgi:hypothetical protein